MATSYEDKIKQQAEQYLEPGEHVQAAFITQPRGATMAKVGGGIPGAIGSRKTHNESRAADGAGLQLANPMALAITESRLVVLSVSAPLAFGKGGDVKGFVSAVPLSEVESIEVKRLLVGKTVNLSVHGTSFKLEANATANAKGLAEAFARAKATV